MHRTFFTYFRYKTRNTFKRHMKIYHGKVVGPGGNLLSIPKSEIAHAHDEGLKLGARQQRAAHHRKQEIQPKVEVSLVEAASPAPAAAGSDKENLEFLHDSDSLQADNDEVAAISREMETREAVLNGKAVIEVKTDSAGSSYPSTDSEFSSPDEPHAAAATAAAVKPEELAAALSSAAAAAASSALPTFDASPPPALTTPKSIKKEAPEVISRKIGGKEKSPNLLLQKSGGAKSAFNPIQELPKRMELPDPKPVPGNHQQAFLANINGKQVLLIPKKPETSKLEERLRFGPAAATSASGPQQKITAGIRLVQSHPYHRQPQQSHIVANVPNQKCSVNVITSPAVPVAPRTVMSQHQ